ncbi:SLAP domain-containing protein [Clostridium tyrobutyricum]|uniref:SLAP domain-containing protein n=1 Tax=Clostridium tyrobutyricum TaxID=1519 RepID=UPI00189CEDB5|nr:SLAP domain-containing protein [Clostridium tyrobutyricum]
MVKKAENNKKNKGTSQYVSTKLSLSDKDDVVISDVQKELLKDEIKELPPIKEGQLNLSGIYIYDLGEKYELKIYVRNGLSDNLNLEDIPIVIKDSKGKIIASKMFDFRKLGELPPHSVRPLKLYFNKNEFEVDKIPEKWEVALNGSFKISRKVKPEYEGLLENISDKDQKVLETFLEGLPDIEEGEFSISTFSIGINTDGTILATCVMRNASHKSVAVNTIPITLLNEKNQIVNSNKFELKDFSVNSYRARLCNFSFQTGIRPEKAQELKGWSIAYKLYKQD